MMADDGLPRDSVSRRLMQERRQAEARRRRRRRVVGLAAALVLIAAAGLGSWYVGRGWDPSPGAAEQAGNGAVTSLPAPPPTTAPAPTTPPASPLTVTTAAPPAPASTVASAAPTTTTVTTPAARPVASFDIHQTMTHVRFFADDLGVRRGGTEAEWKASRYAADLLGSLGYETKVVEVPIPNGLTSHNVIATRPGASPLTVLIGAHIDSKKPSPGGNDNASGAAAVLELARAVAAADLVPTVVFVLFGNEEMIDSDPDHHHYGSRAYVADMTPAQRADLVAMISLDMIGYGDVFTVRTMGKGPESLSDALLTYGERAGVELVYLRDPSSFGYSDHEPFELAGYPAVWLEWREDPLYHTSGDTASHVDPARIETAGTLVLGFLAKLTEGDLRELSASRDR
jgi:hypothetical protein